MPNDKGILSSEQIANIDVPKLARSVDGDTLREYARAVEQTVLQSLSSQPYAKLSNGIIAILESYKVWVLNFDHGKGIRCNQEDALEQLLSLLAPYMSAKDAQIKALKADNLDLINELEAEGFRLECANRVGRVETARVAERKAILMWGQEECTGHGDSQGYMHRERRLCSICWQALKSEPGGEER